jgi:hypothetical protein
MAIAPAARMIGSSLRATHLVSDHGQECLSSMPANAAIRMGFAKLPGSSRGYRPHPRWVKRQRSTSLATLRRLATGALLFAGKIGMHRGKRVEHPIRHHLRRPTLPPQQLGAIGAQDRSGEGLVPSGRSVTRPCMPSSRRLRANQRASGDPGSERGALDRQPALRQPIVRR